MKHIFRKSTVLFIVFLSFLLPATVWAQDFIPVEGFSFECSHCMEGGDNYLLTIAVGDVGSIHMYPYPDDATIQEFSFVSSAPDIISVSNGGGIIRALRAGDATITIRSMDPECTQVETIIVKVIDITQGGLAIEPDPLNLETGDLGSVMVTVQDPEYPGNFHVSNVTWSISDDMVAKIDNEGAVTAITPGEAIITATTATGITATGNVTVVRKPPSKPLQPKAILVSGAVESGNMINGALKAGSQVKILCDTEYARIKYTLDGSDPELSSDTWPASGTNVITINQNTTIRAVAVNEYVLSNEFTGNYVVKLKQPISNSSDIVYQNSVYPTHLYGAKVELYPADFTGGEIRYTVDGSEPDQTSRLYTAPITLNESLPKIYYTSTDFTRNIKAKVFKDGYQSSDVRMFAFRVVLAELVYDPLARTLTCATPDTEIRYTTDGSTPSATSTLYTGPFSLPESGILNICARAFKDGFNPTSTVKFEIWSLRAPLPTPVVLPYANAIPRDWVKSPATIVVTPGHEVRLLCEISWNYLGTVHYTTNGTEPTESSTEYINGSPIIINSATTIKAKAFRSGHHESETATFTFNMAPAPPAPKANVPSGSIIFGTKVNFISEGVGGMYEGYIYTTNGSTPQITNPNAGHFLHDSDCNGSLLPLSGLTMREDCTIKVRAYKYIQGSNTNKHVVSPVSTFTYQVNPEPFNSNMGTFNFNIPGSIPMLKNKNMNLNMNSIAGNRYGSNGTVKTVIGNNFASGKNTAAKNADFEILKKKMNNRDYGGVKSVVTPIGKSMSIAGCNANFEIAGYMENAFNTSGNTIIMDNQIMLHASAKTHWNMWITYLTVGVGLEVGVNWWGNLTIGSGDNLTPQSVLEYYVGVSTQAGIGIPIIGSVGVWGSATFHHQWDMIHNYNKMWLNGKVGVYEKFLCFTARQTILNGNWNIMNTFRSSSTESSMYDFRNYKLMPRSATSEWLGASPVRRRSAAESNVMQQTVLQHSVYPETAPGIAGMRLLNPVMVFLADDDTRDDYNRTLLMYSVYGPGRIWSSPQAVYNSGRADFYPNIATSGDYGEIWMAWQQSKTTFNATSTIEDMFAAGEIVVAKYDEPNGTFEAPVTLTDNAFMDATPKVAVAGDGTVFVTWIQNSENDFYGTNGKNKIMAAAYNGSAWTAAYEVKSGLGPVIDLETAYFGGKYQIAYVTDRDNDLETIDDRDLVIVDQTGTVLQTPVTDKLVSGVHFATIASTSNEKGLSWFEEGWLRCMTEDNAVKTLNTEPDMQTHNYKIFSRGVQMAVVYPYCVDEVGYLFARDYDYESGQLGKPYRLAKTGGYAGYFDGIIADGFEIAYNNSIMSHVDDELEEENDLVWMRAMPPVNIRLTDISYSQEEVKLGQPLTVSLEVENIGGITVDDFVVIVNGIEVGEYPADLKTGEKKILDFPLNVPASMAPMTNFVITVEPARMTDDDPDDNSLTIALGYVNFSLLPSLAYNDNNTVTVRTDLTNNSDFAANAMLLTRLGAADGEVIDFVNLGNIAGRQNKLTDRVYNMESLFPKGENYMPLYLELVTDADAEFGISEFVVIYNDNNLLSLSGYAFEMVDSEPVPLAGVTATCWVADDENGANAKMWSESMNDDEQANPQITQEGGSFGWVTPEGWWQVRLTKNGYEDARSEWLPVPPSQFTAIEMMKTESAITGIDEFGMSTSNSDNSVFVYPNPTTGQLRIESRELEIESIAVFDVAGRRQNTEYRKQENSLSSGNGWSESVLDISHLPSGIYLLWIKTNDRVVTRMVVKN